MKINDEPAFPQASTSEGSEAYVDPGMSLRDYFAGQCLVGRVAREPIEDFADVADLAYRMADAMLAEREGVK